MKEHSPFINESSNRAKPGTARKLVKEFGLDVRSQGYHYEGDFYGPPETYEYPIAFFDLYGHVIINTEHELRSKMDVTKRVHKAGGICKMNIYTKYPYVPENIIDYKNCTLKSKKLVTKRMKRPAKIIKKHVDKVFSIIKSDLPTTCMVCRNDFTDIEYHYLKNPSHRT